jgi:flavin reductase (DIM6/NTAB) family NADH-FMN oxidoreductase RutF
VEDLLSALAQWASGVTLVTFADDRDDIGVTVSAFLPLSAEPPLVAVALMAESYPAEVFGRGLSRFAVTLLAASQKMLAGRFSAAGRPGARLMLADVPHDRGKVSGALIPSSGLAAVECRVSRLVTAGDHLLVIGSVANVAYVAESGSPLLRHSGRYTLTPSRQTDVTSGTPGR